MLSLNTVSCKDSMLNISYYLKSWTIETVSWWQQGQEKRTNTSKGSKRKIKTDVLSHVCRSIGEEVNFTVPRVESSLVPISLDPKILEAHVKFRFAAEPWLDVTVKKNEKKFGKELESVYSTFPTIADRTTILAMAAWLFVLCEVDDLTEKLEPMDAKRALQDARNMTWKDSGTSLETAIDWREKGSTHEMIQHIVREFRIYTLHLLPAVVYNLLMKDVNKVFHYMTIETNFRKFPPPSIDAYMKIRRQTVGISPFVTLVEGSLDNSMSCRETPLSAPLTELKLLLNEIIGLQNDLVGLDKDIDAGWSVNVVTVTGGLRLRVPDSEEEKFRVLKECTREAEKMYADAMRDAIECCEAVYQGSKVENEKELCGVVMGFIARCLKWHIACQRYKASK